MPGRNGGTLNRGGSPGRPRATRSLAARLEETLDEPIEGGLTRGQDMFRKIIALAGEANTSCLHFIERVKAAEAKQNEELVNDILRSLLDAELAASHGKSHGFPVNESPSKAPEISLPTPTTNPAALFRRDKPKKLRT